GQINEITADVILLDHLLAEYGDDTRAMRQNLRRSVGLFVERFWQEPSARSAATGASLVPAVEAEKIYHDLRLLVPSNESQHHLRDRALATVERLAQLALLLSAEGSLDIPEPFLAVLVLWLIIIFFSFGLPAPPNPTIVVILFLCALSASAAIYLILDMTDPFGGLMAAPREPLRNALRPLGSSVAAAVHPAR